MTVSKRILSCAVLVVSFATYLGISPRIALAANLSTLSDTISTSRPSASAVLSADQAASATQFTVIDLGSANGDMYIASDSATFLGNTGETTDFNVNYVASAAAQVGGSPNTRIIYMTTTVTHSHHKGDSVIVPITAVHTIGFTNVTALPANGKIVLTFPTMGAGEVVNTASPSASTFETNGLPSNGTNIKVWDSTASSDITGNFTGTGGSITVTAPTAGTAPIITFVLNNATTLAGSHSLKIFLGCSAVSSGNCTTQVPTLINPNKISTAGTGDPWRIQIDTQDASGNGLDTGKVKVNTIESVQVFATVEPSLTFIISPILIGTTYNSVQSQCGTGESNNAGIDATATVVNLGTLTNGATNNVGQRLRVSTNGASGYVITATSSGHFLDPATGYWITDANGGTGLTANDTPAPATMTSGTASFGISPCGARVNTSTWGSSGSLVNSGGTSTAKFSNPYNSGTAAGYYASIASYSSGPISNDDTVVRYAATVSGTTPPGIYQNVFTYVATATF